MTYEIEPITHEHPLDEHPPNLRDVEKTLANLPRIVLLSLVRIYQLTFSRVLPADTCRFYPTCSHYGFEAIHKYGVFKGGWMAFKRILRCQPFNPGGYDPVP
jgi:putative membrane protein insertion efficiency factor